MIGATPQDTPPPRQAIIRVIGFGVDPDRDARTINAHLQGIVTCATCAAADLINAEAWIEGLNSAPNFRLGIQIGESDDPDAIAAHFSTVLGRQPDHILAADGVLIDPFLPDPPDSLHGRQTVMFGAPHTTLGDLLLLITLIPPGLTEIACNPSNDPANPIWTVLTHRAARELITSDNIQLVAYSTRL